MSTPSMASILVLAALLTPARGAQQPKPGCVKCQMFAGNTRPKYRVARKIRISANKMIIDISVKKDEFTRESLIRLACQLDRDMSVSDLLVRIFDDFGSAKRYVAPWQQEKPAGWMKYEASLRATYVHEHSTGEHWIAWYVNAQKTKQEKVDLCPAR